MKDKLTRADIRRFLGEGIHDPPPATTKEIMIVMPTFLNSLYDVPGVSETELDKIIKLFEQHRQTLRRGNLHSHINDMYEE
jgi:hypothetical protein